MWCVKKIQFYDYLADVDAEDYYTIVLTGTDPVHLAKQFCKKYILPTVLVQGLNNHPDVKELLEREDWKAILNIYRENSSDLFVDVPESLEIIDEANNAFYAY